MLFKSEKQKCGAHANHPLIAKQWENENLKGKKLPERTEKRGSNGSRK
jgi:hypothetical protein